MAKATWLPIAKEILDGKHDEALDHIEQAAKHRQKQLLLLSGIRPGARVTLMVNPRNGQFAGRSGIVEKLNPKRVTVNLECAKCGSAKEVADSVQWADRCEACHGIPESVGIPRDLLEVTR